MSTGADIKAVRQSLAMSQPEMASRLGLHPHVISVYEARKAGRHVMPSARFRRVAVTVIMEQFPRLTEGEAREVLEAMLDPARLIGKKATAAEIARFSDEASLAAKARHAVDRPGSLL